MDVKLICLLANMDNGTMQGRVRWYETPNNRFLIEILARSVWLSGSLWATIVQLGLVWRCIESEFQLSLQSPHQSLIVGRLLDYS